MDVNIPSEAAAAPVRVALIDDSSEVRFLLSTMMEMDGRFEIVGEADDAATGIELVADVDPDLILVDLRLGRRDGTWLIKKLRRQNHSATIAVVTGSIESHDHLAALDAGADSVHFKTTMITTMADELASVVGERRTTAFA